MGHTGTSAPDAHPAEGNAGIRRRLAAGAGRVTDVRIFSSASDAPRARRPTDGVLLALCLIGVASLAVLAPGPGRLDTAITGLVKALPGLFGWFWELSFDALLGWSLLLVIGALAARGRGRLVLVQLLGGGLAFAAALGAGAQAGTGLHESLRAVSSSAPPAVYVAVRLAVAVAVIAASSPHLSRPLKYIGRWVIAAGAFASVALGIALPVGVAAGLAVGLGAAALAHLILGSPGGRLSLEQMTESLAALGIQTANVRYAALEPRGVSLVRATTPEGRTLLVKIYGRDAWDGQFVTSIWASLWTRGATPHVGGRLRQVEHEALVALFAERGGVSVLPVVAAGLAEGRDAVLVIDARDAEPMASLGPDDVTDDALDDLWRVMLRLADVGVAHGSIDGLRILMTPDGHVALADFGEGDLAPTDAAVLTDRAQALVASALAAGPDRAVAAAARAIGTEALAALLPYLQPAAVDRATRHGVKERDWSIDDLRDRASEAAGVEPPALEQLRRVSVGSIVTVVVIGLIAYAAISAIANIGWQTLVDEFKQADLPWLVAALVVSPMVGGAQAFSTIGSCIRPVRLGPALMLQYGVQFIALAVPSSAARVALEIRFFERVGLSAGGAVAVGVIDSVSGFVIQILLILVITLSGLATLDLSSSDSSATFSGKLLLVAAVAAVLLAVVALAVPRARAFVREKTADVRQGLAVLRSPGKVLLIFAGNLVAQMLFAIILGLCLEAFGHRLNFAELVLTNTLVSLFAGFMPVPGGMGVAEAGYTTMLSAFGVPHAAALSTAMSFRLVTYYLPPIWGAFAMKWLRGHSYL